MSKRILFLISCFCMGFFGSRVTSDPPAPAPKVLVYCDLTRGGLIATKAYYQTSLLLGKAPTLVTEPSSLSCALGDGPWTDVFVAVKWTESEPEWLPELRTYSNSHPEVQIAVSTWHDAGQSTPACYSMFATLGTAYWRFDQTNLGYALPQKDDRENPQNLPGKQWPSFVDIVPMVPIPEQYVTSPVAFIMNQDATPPTTQPAPTPPDLGCVLIEMGKYWSDVFKCSGDRSEMEVNCNKMHGPNAQAPFAPNPEKHAKCLIETSDTYKKCTENALSLYKNRVAANCTTQPAQ